MIGGAAGWPSWHIVRKVVKLKCISSKEVIIIELDHFERSADVRCCVWESCDDMSALLAHEVERGRSMLLHAPQNTPRRQVRGSSRDAKECRCARTRLIASTVIPLFSRHHGLQKRFPCIRQLESARTELPGSKHAGS